MAQGQEKTYDRRGKARVCRAIHIWRKIEEIYVGRMPDDGQEILVKTIWGVYTDIVYVDGVFIGLEGVADWSDVEYWAEMPRGE